MAEPYKHIYKVDLNQPLKRFDVGDILASGDEKANSFEVVVCRDGANVDLTGCTVYGYFIRPNDETMKVDGTADGNFVRVEPSKNCYVYDGAFSLAIKLTGNGITQTVAVFDGRIVRTTSDNIVDGDRVIYGLEDLLAQIAAVESATVNADMATGNANTAASNATAATTRANNAAASIENVTASAASLGNGEEATATVTEVDGVKHFSFGIPRGERGEKGEKGDPGTAENVTITSIAGLEEALAEKIPVGYISAWNDGGLSIAKAKEDGSMYPFIGATAEGKLFTLVEGDTFKNALMEDETASDASKLGGVDASDYLQKSQVVNNFTTTEEGFVADARALKELSDRIGSAGSEAEEITTTVENASLYTKNTMGCRKLGKVVCVSGTVVVGSTAITNKAFRSGLPNTSNGVNTLGTDDDGNPTAIYLLNGSVFIRKAAAGEIVYFAFTYIADE